MGGPTPFARQHGDQKHGVVFEEVGGCAGWGGAVVAGGGPGPGGRAAEIGTGDGRRGVSPKPGRAARGTVDRGGGRRPGGRRDGTARGGSGAAGVARPDGTARGRWASNERRKSASAGPRWSAARPPRSPTRAAAGPSTPRPEPAWPRCLPRFADTGLSPSERPLSDGFSPSGREFEAFRQQEAVSRGLRPFRPSHKVAAAVPSQERS